MAEVERTVGAEKELRRMCTPPGYGPARSYAISGHQGTVGFIGQVSEPRCDECNKLRIGADGALSACLFSRERISLRPALERGDSEAIREILRRSFLSRELPPPWRASWDAWPMMAMYQIGG